MSNKKFASKSEERRYNCQTKLIAARESQPTNAENQCDGCCAGMPIKNGKHYLGDRAEMVCQKNKYKAKVEANC